MADDGTSVLLPLVDPNLDLLLSRMASTQEAEGGVIKEAFLHNFHNDLPRVFGKTLAAGHGSPVVGGGCFLFPRIRIVR